MDELNQKLTGRNQNGTHFRHMHAKSDAQNLLVSALASVWMSAETAETQNSHDCVRSENWPWHFLTSAMCIPQIFCFFFSTSAGHACSALLHTLKVTFIQSFLNKSWCNVQFKIVEINEEMLWLMKTNVLNLQGSACAFICIAISEACSLLSEIYWSW